jgi:TonB-linked SusC/RagA family outer membrane protein
MKNCLLKEVCLDKWGKLKKMLLIMKLTIFLTCTMIFDVSAGIYSQSMKINLSMANVTVEKVLREIKKVSNYDFMYDANLIEKIGKVNVNLKDSSVEEILEICLKGSNVDFEIVDDVILLVPSEKEITEKIIKEKVEVKGKITDDKGEPLPGATIMEKGTINGTVSDKNGNYSFSVDGSNAVLKITYIGFESQEIKVGDKTIINITLKPSASKLDEVVVTGYQTLSVNKSAGATQNVKAEVFERKSNSNVLESLEGQVAGLGLFSDPTKEGKKTLNIRGVTTLNGIKGPLIVVDGFILEADISTINPYDIESVTVLKDAAASSIYGARAANGVIVITTKKGKKGKLKVDYRNTFSFTPKPDLAYRLNRMSSSEFVDIQIEMAKWEINDIKREYGSGVDKETFFADEGYASMRVYNPVYRALVNKFLHPEDASKYEKTINDLRKIDNTKQWEKYFFQNQMEMQHNISISGGGEKNTFRASLNYTSNRGQRTGSKSERIIFNVLNNYVFSKKTNMDIIANITFSTNERTPISESIMDNVFSYSSLVDEIGNPAPVEYGDEYVNVFDYNYFPRFKTSETIRKNQEAGLLDESYRPLKELGLYTSHDQNFSTRLQARLNTKITKNLTAHLGFQYEIGNDEIKNLLSAKSYEMTALINDYTLKKVRKHSAGLNEPDEIERRFIPIGDRLIETRGRNNSYILRGQLDFNKIFRENHALTLFMGSEIRHVFKTSTTVDRYGYNKETLLYQYINKSRKKSLDGTFAEGGEPGLITFADGFTENTNRYFSLYGNFTYGYKNRYLLSGSMRIDQSNLFGTDPKYRYLPFWTLATKWKISEEDFFNVNAINSLSLRLSYGVNGNVPRGYGPFDIVEYLLTEYGGPDPVREALKIISPAVYDLRWERTNTINIGFDIAMFNDKLLLNIDMYNKQTFDLLAESKIDPTQGFTSVMFNRGDINNKGIEISLNTVNIQKNDFSWSSDLNFRYNKNRITKVFNTNSGGSRYADLALASVQTNSGLQNFVGSAANSFRLFDYRGLNEKGHVLVRKKNKEIVEIDNKVGTGQNIQTWQSSNWLIDAGTVDPIYTLSLTNTISYKNIVLSFMFVGNAGHVLKSDSYNGDFSHSSETPSSLSKDAVKRWKKPGDEKKTDIPPLRSYPHSITLTEGSTKNIVSANYIRLRELILTYSLPNNIIHNSGLKRVSFNAKVNNLFIITANKKGIDPEVHGIGVRYSRIKPSFGFGVQISF